MLLRGTLANLQLYMVTSSKFTRFWVSDHSYVRPTVGSETSEKNTPKLTPSAVTVGFRNACSVVTAVGSAELLAERRRLSVRR
jgi:hypothetical protein